jgi:5'-deoxynucleotidase YfbR-like HD superfamily hydrolase
MSWTQTLSGKKLDFQQPTVAMIDLSDITHALARIPRFGGQLNYNWTVAQHSLLVYYLTEALLANTRFDISSKSRFNTLLRALFHDGHEAYIGDIPAPVGAFLAEIEPLKFKLDYAIFTALGINAFAANKAVIEEADKAACYIEADTFFFAPKIGNWHFQFMSNQLTHGLHLALLEKAMKFNPIEASHEIERLHGELCAKLK